MPIAMFIVAAVFCHCIRLANHSRVRHQKHYACFDEIFPDYKDNMRRLLDDAEYLDVINFLACLSKIWYFSFLGLEFKVVDLGRSELARPFVKNQNGVQSSIYILSSEVVRKKKRVIYRQC